MRILAEFLRDEPQQPFLDLQRSLAGRDAGAVGDPEDVRVDRDRRFPERGIEDDVGGLAADARQNDLSIYKSNPIKIN